MIVGGGIKQGKGGLRSQGLHPLTTLGFVLHYHRGTQCSRHCLLYAPTSKRRLIFSLFSRRPGEKDAKELHGHVFVGLGMCEGVAVER